MQQVAAQGRHPARTLLGGSAPPALRAVEMSGQDAAPISAAEGDTSLSSKTCDAEPGDDAPPAIPDDPAAFAELAGATLARLQSGGDPRAAVQLLTACVQVRMLPAATVPPLLCEGDAHGTTAVYGRRRAAWLTPPLLPPTLLGAQVESLPTPEHDAQFPAFLKDATVALLSHEKLVRAVASCSLPTADLPACAPACLRVRVACPKLGRLPARRMMPCCGAVSGPHLARRAVPRSTICRSMSTSVCCG